MSKHKFVGFIIALILLITGCHQTLPKKQEEKRPHHPDDLAMAVSVSSDGRYVVSTHLNQELVLWDIKTRTKKIITQHANVYSAYFIKNTHDFMWQDATSNKVYIENVQGNIIDAFDPGFATYGQVISSDLQHYFASDKEWRIYSIDHGEKTLVKESCKTYDFLFAGKLLNLTLSIDNQYLLSSGIGDGKDTLPLSAGRTIRQAHVRAIVDYSLLAGVILWDSQTKQPLYKLPGNVGKTFATISPRSQYVVSIDEDGNGYVWSTQQGKQIFTLWNIHAGKAIGENKDEIEQYYSAGLIKPPKDYMAIGGREHTGGDYYFAVKFVDSKGDYLLFPTDIPYAILFNVRSPKPIKYLTLMPQPLPITGDFTKDTEILQTNKAPSNFHYDRDSTIDTAPKANILVTGQRKNDGIIVYKYHPKEKTLKRVWVAEFTAIK